MTGRKSTELQGTEPNRLVLRGKIDGQNIVISLESASSKMLYTNRLLMQEKICFESSGKITHTMEYHLDDYT